MEKNSYYILYTAVALSLIGMVHFLLLLIPVPFPVIAIAGFAAVTWAYIRWRKMENNVLLTDTISIWPGLVLVLTLLYIALVGAINAQPTGAWDAWSIWNYAARYLGMPRYWKLLFLNISNAHSDYPLNQPGVISFFWKLCGREYTTVPFVYSLLMTLLIPALLFFEVYRKGAIIALIVLFIVAGNLFYIDKGLWQYADTTVAFYFLCMMVCLHHAQRSQSPAWMAVSAFMMACCIWTKNEGILIALVAALFYSRDILKKQNLVPFFLTLFLALVPWLILKFWLAPGNDLVEGQKDQSLTRAFELERHSIVVKYFFKELWQEQKVLAYLFIFYCLACLYKGKMLSRQVLIVLCIVVGTWFVYVLTPRFLEWHVSVTMDRMFHMWMPAMVFAIFMDLFRDKGERRAVANSGDGAVIEIA